MKDCELPSISRCESHSESSDNEIKSQTAHGEESSNSKPDSQPLSYLIENSAPTNRLNGRQADTVMKHQECLPHLESAPRIRSTKEYFVDNFTADFMKLACEQSNLY